jgi:hypothetical protein
VYDVHVPESSKKNSALCVGVMEGVALVTVAEADTVFDEEIDCEAVIDEDVDFDSLADSDALDVGVADSVLDKLIDGVVLCEGVSESDLLTLMLSVTEGVSERV